MRTAKAQMSLRTRAVSSGLSLYAKRIIGYYKIFNGEQRPGWYFAHSQDDLNLRILRTFEGMFSLYASYKSHKEQLSSFALYWMYSVQRRSTLRTSLLSMVIPFQSYEAQRARTYLLICAPNYDSNQSAHLRSLIRVVGPYNETLHPRLSLYTEILSYLTVLVNLSIVQLKLDLLYCCMGNQY